MFDFSVKANDERTLQDFYDTEEVKRRCRSGYSALAKSQFNEGNKEIILVHKSNDGEECTRITPDALPKYTASDVRELMP